MFDFQSLTGEYRERSGLTSENILQEDESSKRQKKQMSNVHD